MPVYNVIIKFVDKTDKVIKKVSDFGLWEIGNECNYFYVEKKWI